MDSRYGHGRWPSLIQPLWWGRRSNIPNVMWQNSPSFYTKIIRGSKSRHDATNTHSHKIQMKRGIKMWEWYKLTNCWGDYDALGPESRDGEIHLWHRAQLTGDWGCEYVMAATTTNLGSLLFSSMFLFFFHTPTHLRLTWAIFLLLFYFSKASTVGLDWKMRNRRQRTIIKRKEEREKKSTEYNESEYRTIR